MNKKFLFFWVCFVCLFSGCGRDLKLSVKAADPEKDQPSTALIRKVELSYHSPDGKEQMRQNIAVLGLSQPVSVHSELVKDLKWEPEGVFEARGYTSEGLLLLRGQTKVTKDDGDSLEVVLTRQASQETVLDSPLVRRFRLHNVPTASNFQLDIAALKNAYLQRRGCVELPVVPLSAESGVFPQFVVEAAVKAPSLYYDVHGQRRPFAINGAGDAILEFNRDLLGNDLFQKPKRIEVRLYSSAFEGCFVVNTRPTFVALKTTFLIGDLSRAKVIASGSAQFNAFGQMPAVGRVRVENPNDVDVAVRFQVAGQVSSPIIEQQLCWSLSDNEVSFSQLKCTNGVNQDLVVPARQYRDVVIFGVMMKNPSGFIDFRNRNFRVNWVVQSLETGFEILSSSGMQDIP